MKAFMIIVGDRDPYGIPLRVSIRSRCDDWASAAGFVCASWLAPRVYHSRIRLSSGARGKRTRTSFVRQRGDLFR